jgi:hypothetical protein
VIPADLGAELTAAVRAGVAAGELPPAAARVSTGGTWRPVPGRPASYATSLPFTLGRLAGHDPAAIADRLGRAVAPAPWISSAGATGDGYLTITVTPAALAGLAVRITRAGPRCARGAAAGDPARPARPVPPLPDLAAAPDWHRAWQDQAAALAARLARAAGTPAPAGRGPSGQDPERGWPSAHVARQGHGPVASAVTYAGAEVVRYWLARMLTWRGSEPDGGPPVTRDLSNPFYAVTFAQADAASVLRWAADLGLRRDERDEGRAGRLGEPAELAMLARLSWLGERVAGAARRGRPAELPRYLEELAADWLDCRESCPALPFGGRAAPRDAAGISARLWLAAATATALAAGLDLIGVSATVPGWPGL